MLTVPLKLAVVPEVPPRTFTGLPNEIVVLPFTVSVSPLWRSMIPESVSDVTVSVVLVFALSVAPGSTVRPSIDTLIS